MEFTAHASYPTRYIVCNADEGEPGTNKDRILLSTDPCAVFEGMAIAGKAVGAHTGYIYLRAEYTYLFPVLKDALEDAENADFRKNMMESGFDFEIKFRSGAGAYVCGEETALFESIEGKRGEPRFRPPFPSIHGLFGKPTMLNNVETLANIAPILLNGAEWYRSIGTANSPGTKLLRSVEMGPQGVFEFPMGVNLKDIIYEVCGGIADGKGLLGVQTGGTSGAIINADQIDMTLDIDTVSASGGRLGCGTILVIDDSNCIVDIVRNNLTSSAASHAENVHRAARAASSFTIWLPASAGAGDSAGSGKIDELTETMRLTALCGLGHSTAVPVQTSIQNFRKEYLAHIDRDYCPVCAQAAVAEGIYEAEEDYRNDGNSRMGRRRAAVGERDVMYDSYDAYARHRSRGTSYAGRFERRGGREA